MPHAETRPIQGPLLPSGEFFANAQEDGTKTRPTVTVTRQQVERERETAARLARQREERNQGRNEAQKRAQRISEQSVGRRFLTGAQAFIPDVPGLDLPGEGIGRAARRDIRAVRETTGSRTLEFIGPPGTQTEAGLEAALSVVPFGFVGRPAARGAGRLGTRAAGELGGEAIERAPRTISRLGAGEGAPAIAARGASREAGEVARRRATRTAASESAETAATRRAAREAGEESPGLLARGARFARRRPGTTGAIAGAGLTAATLPFILGGGNGDGDSVEGRPGTQGSPGRQGDPGTQGSGSGAGGGGTGGQAGGTVAPPFATGILANVTAGIGSLFDQLGRGIRDLLNAIGIPVGEGVGKAIAIGGTILLIAIAVQKSGILTELRLAGGNSGSGGGGAKRGPAGKFLPKGA